MKKLILIALILIIQSCKTKYYGYIYDFDTEKPLKDVKISGNTSSKSTMSKDNGYFEIEFNEKEKNILFSKKKYQTHILQTLSIQNGEQMRELPFGDTIFLISNESNYKRPKVIN